MEAIMAVLPLKFADPGDRIVIFRFGMSIAVAMRNPMTCRSRISSSYDSVSVSSALGEARRARTELRRPEEVWDGSTGRG